MTTSTAPTLFAPALLASPLRAAISTATRAPEPALLPGLLQLATLPPAQAQATQALALQLARGVRERAQAGGRAGLVQGLLQEFALSSAEGVALMCLAEALLRIPDTATRDALIRDKIADANWQQHLGQSPSLFVNAASWGLLLTGKLVATHSDTGLSATLRRAVARGGEPLIRRGVDMAMRMMGEQFVTGQTIGEALKHATEREAQGFRFSYDMLGEAALTHEDAQRYAAAYEQAIQAIGAASAGRGIVQGPGISIKLSALHQRYVRAQVGRVKAELYPTLLHLATLARQYDIGLNIDAEESERLELSLDLIEALSFEPGLAGWNGLGVVIQAYQKRCPAVVDYLVDLARRSRRRLMVRLVKGAYWDSEIKRAQLDGQAGYPVYTRKPYTDVAYIACARKLLAAPDAVFAQFATHNAHTVAAVLALAGPGFDAQRYEFQCLHGMGEPLYEQVVAGAGVPQRPCRIYAPVGTHDTLLAYLVRRLLENGANTSFVNRIADDNIALEELVQDPVLTVLQMAEAAGSDGSVGAPHPAIALPPQLLLPQRANSSGLDLADETTLSTLDRAFAEDARRVWLCEPMLARDAQVPAQANMAAAPWQPVLNPADPADTVGRVREASADEVQAALADASAAAPAWAATPAATRAACLEAAAQRLQDDVWQLVPLLAREAGKTAANAVAEVREAVDFLRYYAAQLRRDFAAGDGTVTPGAAVPAPAAQGHAALGAVVCISPWNFPLAIFTGQVAAALAAGNTVLAKPAEQTPLVAAAAVAALHAAGVPRGALQLLPGRGETVGAALVADARVQGVLFTGSTEVARILQRTLAGRLTGSGQPVPLIAETGGQNALVVDSSALVEQAVADIVSSAFDSAGQRCSALRLLCVQDDVADRLLAMLQGAVQELALGDPRALSTDLGPVIDAEARSAIEDHVAAMQRRGCRVWRAPLSASLPGHFVPPTLIEIARVSDLGREVFGPVLHVLRYRRDELPALLQAINSTGYGLTQGVHTRIDETVAQVVAASHAGNLYVNRNIVGAVVGVQPFGGHGLSGTGPKAGGPLYLLRLLSRRPPLAARLAVGRSGGSPASALPSLRSVPSAGPGGTPTASAANEALYALRDWARTQSGRIERAADLVVWCDQAAAESPVTDWLLLPGPTGEANLYAVQPREHVLCLAAAGESGDGDRLLQLAAVLAVGAHAVWPADARVLAERLPLDVQARITLARDWTQPTVPVDVVLQHGDATARRAVAAALAQRAGPIVGQVALDSGDSRIALERLVVERSLSVNTAAAGGNASLMTLG